MQSVTTLLIIQLFSVLGFRLRVPPVITDFSVPQYSWIYVGFTADLSFMCTASGQPPPTVSWHRINDDKSRVITTNPRYHVESKSNGSYTTSTLRLIPEKTPAGLQYRSGHAATYQCKAENEHGKTKSRTFAIHKAYIAGKPTDTRFDLSAAAGSRAVLKCPHPPSFYPVDTYRWQIVDDEGQDIENSDKYVIDPEGNLHILAVSARDSGVYRCLVSQTATAVSVEAASVHLDVTGTVAHGVEPKLVYNTRGDRSESDAYSTVSVVMGERVQLQCVFEGHDNIGNAPTVLWQSLRKKLADGPSFVIESTTKEHRGLYDCYPEKYDSDKYNHRFFVDVLTAPVMVEHPVSANVTIGGNHTFKCLAEGEPALTVAWYFNGDKLHKVKRVFDRATISGDTGEVLTVSNVSATDVGSFQCNVSNAVDYVMGTAFINPVSKTQLLSSFPTVRNLTLLPNITFNVSVEAIVDPMFIDGATVLWKIDNALVTEHVTVVKDDKILISEIYPELLNTSVHDVTNITCYIRTSHDSVEVSWLGENDILPPVVLTIAPEPAGERDNSSKPPPFWLWIIIAALICVLLVIIIAVLVRRVASSKQAASYPGTDKSSVDEKERLAGHDPEEELRKSGYQPYEEYVRSSDYYRFQPRSLGGSQESVDYKSLGNSRDSLTYNSDLDIMKYNEDGSFIGEYGSPKSPPKVEKNGHAKIEKSLSDGVESVV